MTIRYYMSDWFYNIAIVGLLRILDFNNVSKNLYSIEENYIEIDVQLLDNFAQYYFNYFFSLYNDTNKFKSTIDDAIKAVENYNGALLPDQIKPDNVSKAVEKVIAHFKKYENVVKNTRYVDYYNDFKGRMSSIGRISKKNINEMSLIEVKTVLNDILNFVTIDDIMKKRAANILRSELSEFFGQASFLNPAFKGAYAQDFIEKMDADYIEPIRAKYSNSKPKSRRKAVCYCSICSRVTEGDYHFDEAAFAPIGLSLKENRNYLWNQITSMPLCEECRLLMMCTPAGCTIINKPRKINEKIDYYKEYNFVNLDTSINDLFKVNENFKKRSNSSNPYKELILDIVVEMEQKARWTLQSIFFVEFSSGNVSTHLNYFSIPAYKAEFFINSKTQRLLNSIVQRRFQMDIMEYILSDNDLSALVIKELYDYLRKEQNDNIFDVANPFACFNAVCLKYMLNGFRRGWKDVSTRIINDAFQYGKKLNQYYISMDAKNKVNSIGYKMLNAVKVGNRDEFIDNLIRTCMSIQKPIPDVFISALSEQKADFEDVALAFIAGFISSPDSEVVKDNSFDEEVK